MKVIPRALLFLFSCVILAACTQASMQGMRMKQAQQEVVVKGTKCFQVAMSHRDIQILSGKMALSSPDVLTPSLEMISSSEKVTEKKIEAFSNFHALLQPCRKIIIDGTQRDLPFYTPIFSEQFVNTDGLLLRLIKREISWGEYNQQKRDIAICFSKKIMNAANEVNQRLGKAHYDELAVRQRAMSSLQSYYNQQRLINAINKPTFTNCHYFGNSIQCTSF